MDSNEPEAGTLCHDCPPGNMVLADAAADVPPYSVAGTGTAAPPGPVSSKDIAGGFGYAKGQ